MKRKIIGLVLAAAMAISLAACGMKEASGALPDSGGEHVYECGGMKLAVPSEYDGLVNVTVPDEIGEDGILFAVAEKASVEAAKKQGDAEDGAGELFAIGRVSESELNERRCYDMSGQEAFARDGDGNYYVYYHPTDVRFTRESYEGVGDENNEDWKQWTMLNEWADGEVRVAFIAVNSGLSAVSFGNTDLDMFLARAAYAADESYTLELPGSAALAPSGADAASFVERLTSGASFEAADDGEMPKGEYATLRFPDADYRFDFFLAPDGESCVRQVWNNERDTMLYKVRYSDGATRAGDIVKEWYDALAAANDGGASPSDLVGTWEEPGTFGGRNNTLTVLEDGGFSFAYAAGGTRVGTVDILAEEHPDGSKSCWYAFYEQDGSLWECFAVPEEKPFDDIYSGQDGAMHLVRVKAGDGGAVTGAWDYVLTTETRTEEEKNDAGAVLATTSYELPTLTAVCRDASLEPPEAQRRVCEAFNKRVAEYSQSLKTVKQLAEDAREQYNEMGEEFQKDFPAHTEEIRVSAHRQIGDLLEVSFQTYGFWGGAHGGSSLFSWHFDLAEGAFVELADLTDRPEELNRMIADEIIDAIGKESDPDGYFEDYAETIRAKDGFEVSFGSNAMVVGFEQYEIAPYAAGIPSFSISYEKLDPFLNERGLRLLAVFVLQS